MLSVLFGAQVLHWKKKGPIVCGEYPSSSQSVAGPGATLLWGELMGKARWG